MGGWIKSYKKEKGIMSTNEMMEKCYENSQSIMSESVEGEKSIIWRKTRN